MINILVADDEHHVVDYLTQMLESQEKDEWNIYRAFSGMEVLELFQRAKVDIALLDIHMPGLDGLEVAGRITEQWIGTHVIFLTAYDNFDYIYQAGKLNIDGYLLKTEDDNVILKKIEQTIEKIRHENSYVKTELQNQKQQILLEHIWHQEIIKELTGGFKGKRAKDAVSEEIGFPLEESRKVYVLFLVRQRKSCRERRESGMNRLLLKHQFFKKTFSGYFSYALWTQESGDDILLVQSNKEKDLSQLEHLRGMLQGIIDFYADNFHEILHIMLYYRELLFSEICQTLFQILGYDEILNKAGNAAIPVSLVIGKEELDEVEKEKNHYKEFQWELTSGELLFHLQKGDKINYFRILRRLKKDYSQCKSMHHLSAIGAYQTISLMLIEYIGKNSLESELALEMALYPLYYLNDFESWEQAFSYLEKLSEKLFNLQSENVLDKNQVLVRKVKDYIDRNCCKPINLSSISGYVNYNESYVSRLFKQVTGSGIAEYVNRVRLEKACELLKNTQESIQAIALETGFDTPQYFSNVFRKHRGMSPSEYRSLKI